MPAWRTQDYCTEERKRKAAAGSVVGGVRSYTINTSINTSITTSNTMAGTKVTPANTTSGCRLLKGLHQKVDLSSTHQVSSNITLPYLTLLYFTLLYFTLLYFTLLYFTLLYFTLPY